MAYAVRRAAWAEAARLGFSMSGASPGPRRMEPWEPPEATKRNALALFLRGLRGALTGATGPPADRGREPERTGR